MIFFGVRVEMGFFKLMLFFRLLAWPVIFSHGWMLERNLGTRLGCRFLTRCSLQIDLESHFCVLCFSEV